MTATFETARSADGPGIAAFLREHGSASRMLDRWDRGVRADFYAVDVLLIKLGLHPMDVPADLWREGPGFGRPSPTGRPPRPVCKRGHVLAGANLYVDPRGDRRCRACKRLHKRAVA